MNTFDRHTLTNRQWTGWRFERQTLAPGEGALIFHPSENLNLCVPPPGNTRILPLGLFTNCPGCFLLSAQTPLEQATYEDITGFAPVAGSAAHQWDGANQVTKVFTNDGSQWFEAGNVPSSGPRAGPGEAIWICPLRGVPPAVSLCSYALTLQPGYNLVANQCRSDNTVASLFPKLPLGTLLWRFNNRIITNIVSGFGNTPILPLPFANGDGCYLVNGINLVSRQTNAPGRYADIVGEAPLDETIVYRWNVTNQSYDQAIYTDLGGEGFWVPEERVAAVGEPLFVARTAPARPGAVAAAQAGIDPPGVCSYSLTLEPGLNLIANQCLNDNTVATLLPDVPEFAQLIKWDRFSQSYVWPNSFIDGSWAEPNQSLAPGEGAWLYHPESTPLRITITGEPNRPQLPLPLSLGFNLVSRQTNEAGGYTDIVGTDPLKFLLPRLLRG